MKQVFIYLMYFRKQGTDYIMVDLGTHALIQNVMFIISSGFRVHAIWNTLNGRILSMPLAIEYVTFDLNCFRFNNWI